MLQSLYNVCVCFGRIKEGAGGPSGYSPGMFQASFDDVPDRKLLRELECVCHTQEFRIFYYQAELYFLNSMKRVILEMFVAKFFSSLFIAYDLCIVIFLQRIELLSCCYYETIRSTR